MGLGSKEDFDHLIHLDIRNYNIEIAKLLESDFDYFIQYEDLLLDLEEKQFSFVFLRLPSTLKNLLLQNKEIARKVLYMPKTPTRRSFLSALDDSNKNQILSQIELLREVDDLVLEEVMSNISDIQFETLASNLKKYSGSGICSNRIELCEHDIQNLLLNNFDITSANLVENISAKCQTNQLNPFCILRFKQESQLFLYERFGLAVYSQKELEYILERIPYDLLTQINSKDIKRLLSEVDNNTTVSKDIKFSLVVHLYMIFGLDNALKIINQKFSSVTTSLLNRAGEINFIDKRRKYRLEHQNEFYSYEVLSEVEQAVINNNPHIISKITKLDLNEVNNIIPELKQKYENEEYGIEFLSSWLRKSILEREESIKEIYTGDFINKNAQRLGRRIIPYKEMEKQFSGVYLSKIPLDNKGKPILNNKLVNFLLGNTKADNDCTLRLILNKMALGLNDNLSHLINVFNNIERIIKKSTNLSLDSILDVIDINKVLLYELAPNEQTITLETITRIYNSHEHCHEGPNEIMRRAKELYHRMKYKTSSSIPIVFGREDEFISYRTINFHDDTLLVCGIDSETCFRIGGKGEDFLEYCVCNPQGSVIELTLKGKKYISQFVRRGNTIFVNGVDPKETNVEINAKLMKTLEHIFIKMAEISKDYQPIELAVITDFDKREFFENSIYQPKNIEFISNFYSDLGKEDKKFYVLYSKDENTNVDAYEAESIYLKERSPIFEYFKGIEEDTERLELVLNDICYDAIQFENISEKQKNSKKRKYQKISLEDYDYVIGNTDWYILVNKLGITSQILPYDNRAMVEMRRVLHSKEFQNVLDSLNEKEGVNHL